jgi:hypothetical protein
MRSIGSVMLQGAAPASSLIDRDEIVGLHLLVNKLHQSVSGSIHSHVGRRTTAIVYLRAAFAELGRDGGVGG